MNVDLINLETIAPIQPKDIPTPKYNCVSCTRLGANLKCDVFERRVEPDYNRCFNHSSYQPSFKALKYENPSKEAFEKIWEEEHNSSLQAA